MRLSEPFRALSLDLQQRVDAVSSMAAEGKDPFASRMDWEVNETIHVQACQSGTWNGIAFWFQVQPSSWLL